MSFPTGYLVPNTRIACTEQYLRKSGLSMDCLGRLSSSSESSLSEFPSVVRKSFEILRSANIYAAMRIGFGCQREDVGKAVAGVEGIF